MIRSRLLWRLYAGYTAVVVLTTVIFVTLATRRIERDALSETERSLRARTTLAARLLAPTAEAAALSDRVPIATTLHELSATAAARLTLIGADGALIADAGGEPGDDPLPANLFDRPEVLAARSRGAGFAVHAGTAGRPGSISVAAPLAAGGQPAGILLATESLGGMEGRVRRLRDIALLAGGVAGVAGLALGALFAWRISWSLAVMTKAAAAYAESDARHPLPTGSRDEIGALARALAAMGGQLRARMRTATTERNRVLAILSSMVEGVVAVDRDERIIHMNDVAGAVLGASPDEAIGKRLWEVARVREVNEALANVLGDAAPVTREVRLVAGSPEQVVEVHASPLRDGAGQIAGAVIVLHDVTRLRKLETIRSEFVANVSHELKTPLTAIHGLVETLLDDRDIEPERAHRFLGRIHEQTKRLSALVADLLTLSRVESNASPVERARIDLRAVATESARTFAAAAEAKRLALETSLSPEPVIVLGDREGLGHLADNLLDNAVKYTPEGGRIVLRAIALEGRAILEVGDTGIGIAPADQERIFERFYRTDKGRSRELGGTGLGLSIVKHVALAHGGEVSVESEPERGSLFRVTLPTAGGS